MEEPSRAQNHLNPHDENQMHTEGETESRLWNLLSPERASLCQTGLSSGWLAENGRAAGTDDDGLCVREDGGDGKAAGALDVHEERAGSRDKILRGRSAFRIF